jgi:hypothetical protein
MLASDKAAAGLSGIAIGGWLSGAIEGAESPVDVVASDMADAGLTGIAIGGRSPGAAEAAEWSVGMAFLKVRAIKGHYKRSRPQPDSAATFKSLPGAQFLTILVCSLLKPRVSEQRCQLLPVSPKLMDTPDRNGTR